MQGECGRKREERGKAKGHCERTGIMLDDEEAEKCRERRRNGDVEDKKG